jgi:hypothetical protein
MTRKNKKRLEYIKHLWKKWQTPPPPKEKFLLRKKIAQEWREISLTELLIWFSAFASVLHFAAYIDSYVGAFVVDGVVVLLTRSIIRNTEQKIFSFWEWFAILVYTAISIHANIDYYEKLGESEPYIKGGLWPFSVLVLTLVKTSAIRLFNFRRDKYTGEAKTKLIVDTKKEKARLRAQRYRDRQKELARKAGLK